MILSIDFIPFVIYLLLTLSHPREVSRTSRGWERRRWPGEGCKDVHPAPAAEAVRSRRASRAPLGALGGCVPRVTQRAARSRGPRSGGEVASRKRGRPKGQTTGGRAEQASNIARGTPENWRTCGFDKRAALVRKASLRLMAARRSGPRVRVRRFARKRGSPARGPGVPRALLSLGARSDRGAARAPRQAGDGVCLHLAFPSPACGRGSPRSGGERVLHEAQQVTLSRLTLRARHPLPFRERGKKESIQTNPTGLNFKCASPINQTCKLPFKSTNSVYCHKSVI